MTYQKSVESIQIGLLLLGYELPKFGVDGLFGPETANTIEKFKEDHKDEADKKNKDFGISENLRGIKSYILEDLELIELEETDYTNLKHDEDQTKHDLVSKVLLDDIQLAAKNAGVVAKIHFAQHGHPSMGNPSSKSRHKNNIAVDISSIDGLSYGQTGFKEKGDKLKDELVKLGYTPVEENIGASLGPGPKAGPEGVKDNYYVKKFQYKLVPKDKKGNYVQKGSGLEVKNLF